MGRLPVARARRAPRPVELVVLAATRGRRSAERRVWLVRGEGTLFGGLWNLPMAEGKGRGAARALLEAHSIRGRLAVRPAARFEHVLSHRHLFVQLWVARAANAVGARGRRSVALDGLGELGVSRLTDKALAFV